MECAMVEGQNTIVALFEEDTIILQRKKTHTIIYHYIMIYAVSTKHKAIGKLPTQYKTVPPMHLLLISCHKVVHAGLLLGMKNSVQGN